MFKNFFAPLQQLKPEEKNLFSLRQFVFSLCCFLIHYSDRRRLHYFYRHFGAKNSPVVWLFSIIVLSGVVTLFSKIQLKLKIHSFVFVDINILIDIFLAFLLSYFLLIFLGRLMGYSFGKKFISFFKFIYSLLS